MVVDLTVTWFVAGVLGWVAEVVAVAAQGGSPVTGYVADLDATSTTLQAEWNALDAMRRGNQQASLHISVSIQFSDFMVVPHDAKDEIEKYSLVIRRSRVNLFCRYHMQSYPKFLFSIFQFSSLPFSRFLHARS